MREGRGQGSKRCGIFADVVDAALDACLLRQIFAGIFKMHHLIYRLHLPFFTT